MYLRLVPFFYLFASVCPVTVDFFNGDTGNHAPRFRNPQRSTTVERFTDERVQLNCGARGKPRPYIHWYRKGQIIDFKGYDARVTRRKYSIYIKNLQPEDLGVWACKVWNSNGQLWRNFTIIPIDGPQIMFAKVRQICTAKNRTPRQCSYLLEDFVERFYEFSDPHKIRDEGARRMQDILKQFLKDPVKTDEILKKWQQSYPDNGKILPEPDIDVYDDYKNVEPLMFNGTGPMMSDDQKKKKPEKPKKVVIDNAWDSFTEKFLKMQDKRPPKFVLTDGEMRKHEVSVVGGMVRFQCRATGFPVPKIKWFRNNRELDFQTEFSKEKYTVRRFGLEVRDLKEEDSAKYSCKVFNEQGTLEHDFTLTVLERILAKPILDSMYPQNVTTRPGENASFSCKVLSDTNYHVNWWHFPFNASHEDVTRQVAELQTLATSKTDYHGGNIGMDNFKFFTTKDNLTLQNVTYDHSGWYSCVVGNAVGVNYRFAALVVNDKAPPPQAVHGGLSTVNMTIYIFFGVALFFILVAILAVWRSKTIKRKHLFANMAADGANTPLVPTIKKQVIIKRNSLGQSSSSIMPLVQIQSVSGQGRLSSDLTALSEYEIPLDPKWEINREDITMQRVLGEGAFGQVWRGRLEGKGCAAVKMLKGNATDRELTDLVSEMELMKYIGRHTNIINLVGCCTQNGPLYVIVELCDNGNLRDFLRAHRLPESSSAENSASASGYLEPSGLKRIREAQEALTQRDLVNFAFQIARGMDYLGSREFIHRDLAARNVLVTEDLTLKIADFGLARDVAYVDYYKKNSDGRLPVKWMAPEALFDRIYNYKSDTWSYGIVLWEIWTMGGTPYPGIPVERLFTFLKEGNRNDRPHGCIDPVWQVILDCWEYEPSRRPTFRHIVEELDDILSAAVSENYTEPIDAVSLKSVEYPIEDSSDSATVEEVPSSPSTDQSPPSPQSLPADLMKDCYHLQLEERPSSSSQGIGSSCSTGDKTSIGSRPSTDPSEVEDPEKQEEAVLRNWDNSPWSGGLQRKAETMDSGICYSPTTLAPPADYVNDPLKTRIPSSSSDYESRVGSTGSQMDSLYVNFSERVFLESKESIV